MVSNKVYVNNKGIGRDQALSEVERMTDYLNLSYKSKMHIRLLTEEMLGMVSELGGDFNAEFWAEHEGGVCRLCLEADVVKMSTEKRDALIGVSTSGKNAAEKGAAKGIRGKLKDLVKTYWLSGADRSEKADDSSMHWSLSDYKGDIERQKDSGKAEEWDELEKSIVAKIADDVSVGVKGDTVEFIITKSI